MTIECPVCGRDISVSQYCFDEELCYDCLQKIDIGEYEQDKEE